MPKLKISDIKEKYLLFPECILDIEVLQERVSLLKTFFSYAIQKKDLKMAINLYKFLMQRSEELNYQSFNSHLNALFYLLVEEKKNQIYMEKASESPELASPANAMIPDLDILVQELFTSFTKSDSMNENMYTLMIKYYCSCGKHDMAYDLIDEMVKQKHQPHLRSYRYLIKSSPDLKTFNKVYSRLKNQPLKPDTEFFELIFNWLNRNNQLDFKIWETFLSDYQEIHRKLTKNIATLVMKSFEEKCSTTEISKNGVALETGDTLQSIDVTPTQKKNLAALVYYNSNHSNG